MSGDGSIHTFKAGIFFFDRVLDLLRVLRSRMAIQSPIHPPFGVPSEREGRALSSSSRAAQAWRQMPEGSDQLKREKLELGCNLLQLLKESAQKCPVAVLEPMLSDGSRSAQRPAAALC